MKALVLAVMVVSEWWLLFEVGALSGPWAVFAWCVVAITAGLHLSKRAVELLRDASNSEAMRVGPFQFNVAGQVNPERVVHAMLLLASGVLLAFPGLISDLLALVLFVPQVRQVVARRVLSLDREGTSRRETVRPEVKRPRRQEVEVIPPGVMRTPFQPRPRVIDVD